MRARRFAAILFPLEAAGVFHFQSLPPPLSPSRSCRCPPRLTWIRLCCQPSNPTPLSLLSLLSTHLAGIVQSGFHKRRKTGGKTKTWRKKRKFELGRPAANTKVSTNDLWLRAQLAATEPLQESDPDRSSQFGAGYMMIINRLKPFMRVN